MVSDGLEAIFFFLPHLGVTRVHAIYTLVLSPLIEAHLNLVLRKSLHVPIISKERKCGFQGMTMTFATSWKTLDKRDRSTESKKITFLIVNWLNASSLS